MTPERFQRLRRALLRRQTSLTVLMEGVHKPHNYAAVLRSCDAVGALEAHAITSNAVAWRKKPDSPAGASAAEWVRVTVHDDIGAAVRGLRASGHAVVAAHLSERAVDFRSHDFAKPTAILLGSELQGVSDEAAALADQHLVIPMHGMVESLNVSVAAAVMLFEAERQRRAVGLYDAPSLDAEALARLTFEWAYPEIADLCRRRGVPYPSLDADGEIRGPVPR